MTARQHEQQTKGQRKEEPGPALGDPIGTASFGAAGEGSGEGASQQERQRKRYTPVDPKLQAAFDEAKRLLAEAERPAAAVTARPASSAVPTGTAARPPPLALRQAAAAAAGGVGSQKPAVPTFKKVGAATVAGAAPKKPAGPKRAAAGKPPAGPKRQKAAAAAAATAAGVLQPSAAHAATQQGSAFASPGKGELVPPLSQGRVETTLSSSAVTCCGRALGNLFCCMRTCNRAPAALLQ